LIAVGHQAAAVVADFDGIYRIYGMGKFSAMGLRLFDLVDPV